MKYKNEIDKGFERSANQDFGTNPNKSISQNDYKREV